MKTITCLSTLLLVVLASPQASAQTRLSPFQSFPAFRAANASLTGAGPAPSAALTPRSANRPLKDFSARRAARLAAAGTVGGSELLRFFRQRRQGAKPASAPSQQGLISNRQIQALSDLQSRNLSGRGLKAYFNARNGTPSFLQMDIAPSPGVAARGVPIQQAIARAFLNRNRNLLKLNDPGSELRLLDSSQDDLGATHLRFQQQIQGVPVWASQAMLHLDRNHHVYLFNGRYQPTAKGLNTTPAISRGEALQIVLDRLGITAFDQQSSELNIYYDDNSQPHLAWKILIRTDLAHRWLYFIDAHQGQVLHRINMTQHLGQTVAASGVDLSGATRNLTARLENGTYYMIDPTFPMTDPPYDPINTPKTRGDTLVLDARNNKNGGANFQLFLTGSNTGSATNGWDPAAVSAMANTRIVYDYYKTQHGRDGIDGQQKNFMLVIHYDQKLNNAFWNGTAMVFGDGDGQTFSSLAKCLDVTAHEMTHGVIETSANLKYENQSGALNESFADIFGTLVDSANWTLGEGCTLANPQYLRDMANPHNGLSAQPARMSEYQNLPNTPQGDNGGVHTNSGIPNHAFYLIAAGLGTQSIGRLDAGKIFYRALTQYMTASSQFIDARRATLLAAKDLFGASSKQYQAVAAGWDAVEVTDTTAGNGGTPTAPQPSQSSPSNADPVSGADLMVYLYPVDKTRDFNTADQYIVFAQTMTNPVGYQQTQDRQQTPTPANPPTTTAPSAFSRARPLVYTDAQGTVILFVGSDHNVYSVNLGNSPSTPTQETTAGNYWSIAVSPDGSYIAYTTSSANDDTIHIIDTATNTEQAYTVAPPTYQNGSGNLSTVEYADALSFAYDGRTLVYDASNCLPTLQNPCQLNGSANPNAFRFWSIGVMDVTNGRLQYPFMQKQDPMVDLAYPAFASNNRFVVAFDVIDYSQKAATGQVQSSTVIADFEHQTLSVAYNFGGNANGFYGVPSFWGNDDAITIQVPASAATTTDLTSGTNALQVGVDKTTWKASGATAVINPWAVAMPIMHRQGVRQLTGSLSVSANSINFGDVALGQRVSKTLTLSNPGNSDINITRISISGNAAASFSHNATNMLLPRGARVDITLTFDAGQSAGAKLANIAFSTDASNTPVTVSLTANSGSSGGGGGGGALSGPMLMWLLALGLLGRCRRPTAVRRQDRPSA